MENFVLHGNLVWTWKGQFYNQFDNYSNKMKELLRLGAIFIIVSVWCYIDKFNDMELYGLR